MASSPARRSGTKGVARAEREAQIVQAAGELFGEHGFAGTSVADVAERAGISKPLIYNYFGSKEGLYAACLGQAGELIASEIERSAGLGAVGLARAAVTLSGMFAALEPHPWTWRLVGDTTKPATPEIAAIEGRYRTRILALAREGVGELLSLAGDTDPLDVDAMTAVWSSVFDALVTWWLDHPEVSPDEMTERSVRLFTSAFGPVDLELPATGWPVG